MNQVTVLGNPYRTEPLDRAKVAPGALLYGKMARRAMRVVCLDGDDAVLRNIRHPNLLEAEPLQNVSGKYYHLVPASA